MYRVHRQTSSLQRGNELQFIMPDIPAWSMANRYQFNKLYQEHQQRYRHDAGGLQADILYTFIAHHRTTEVINPDDGKKKKVYVLNLRTRAP